MVLYSVYRIMHALLVLFTPQAIEWLHRRCIGWGSVFRWPIGGDIPSLTAPKINLPPENYLGWKQDAHAPRASAPRIHPGFACHIQCGFLLATRLA